MHKCLKCGKKFERITREMLNGCPECGGRLFLYIREGEGGEMDATATELVDRIKIEERGDMSPDERIESLRILGTGIYELNLGALMEKKELIMGIKQDGSYVIHLPSLFAKKRR